jgi:hypothetical protein
MSQRQLLALQVFPTDLHLPPHLQTAQHKARSVTMILVHVLQPNVSTPACRGLQELLCAITDCNRVPASLWQARVDWLRTAAVLVRP